MPGPRPPICAAYPACPARWPALSRATWQAPAGFQIWSGLTADRHCFVWCLAVNRPVLRFFPRQARHFLDAAIAAQ